MPLQRGNPRLNVLFAQTIVRADYIQHLYSVFYNFVCTPPRVKNIRGGGARDRKCMWFQTYSHPEFKFYDEAHEYKGLRRKKRVPQNIHELLTPRGLAYWFMDDGTYSFKNRKYYRFSTHSLPLEDQEMLVQALRGNFEIHANIQKSSSHYIFSQNLLIVLSI